MRLRRATCGALLSASAWGCGGGVDRLADTTLTDAQIDGSAITPTSTAEPVSGLAPVHQQVARCDAPASCGVDRPSGFRILAGLGCKVTGSITTPVVTWTGSEVLLLDDRNLAECGAPWASMRTVAAAYDPSTDRWRPIAEPPVSEGAELKSRLAAWTGDRWVLWNGDNTIEYTPTDDRWRVIDGPYALKGFVVGATWAPTSAEVLFFRHDWAARTAAVVAYRAATGAWRNGPTFTTDSSSGDWYIGWDGVRAILASRGDSVAVSYDPVLDAFVRLPAHPPIHINTNVASFPLCGAVAFWGGDNYGEAAEGGIFRDGSWVALPPPGGALRRLATGWAGDGMIWLTGGESVGHHTMALDDGYTWDLTRGEWTKMKKTTPLPGEGSGSAAVWTGCEALIFGGPGVGYGYRP